MGNLLQCSQSHSNWVGFIVRHMALLSLWNHRLHNACVAQHHWREFNRIHFLNFCFLQKFIHLLSVPIADDWSHFGFVLIELLVIFPRCAHQTDDSLDFATDRFDFRNCGHGVRLLGTTNTFHDNSLNHRYVLSQANSNFITQVLRSILSFFLSGLISLILLSIGLINGIGALWSRKFSKLTKIKPVFTKLLHNVIGIAAFVVGKLSNGNIILKNSQIILEIGKRLLCPHLAHVPFDRPIHATNRPNVGRWQWMIRGL